MTSINKQAVKQFLLELQDSICLQLEQVDGQAKFEAVSYTHLTLPTT